MSEFKNSTFASRAKDPKSAVLGDDEAVDSADVKQVDDAKAENKAVAKKSASRKS